MKRLLAFVVIAALGILTIGCDSQKGMARSENIATVVHVREEALRCNNGRRYLAVLWGRETCLLAVLRSTREVRLLSLPDALLVLDV